MSSLVLLKKANFVIPETEIVQAVQKFQACYGMAGASDDFDSIDVERGVLHLSAERLKETVAGIMDNQDAFKDASLAFHFSAVKLSPESQQPFIIQSVAEDGKDLPLVVAFISAGDYAKHAEPSSAHSPEFFAFAKFLRPTLINLFNDPLTAVDGAVGDPDKVRELMDGRIETLINGLCGDAGAMTVMFYDGKSNTYINKATKGVEFEWGWKSEPWQRAAVVAPSAPVTQGRRRRSLVSSSDPTPTTLPTVTQPEPVATTDANVINASFAQNGSKAFVRARPKNIANKARKKAYETFNAQKATSGRGVVPNAWRQRVGIEVSKETIAEHRDYFLAVMEVIPDTAADPKSTTSVASGVVPAPTGQSPSNVTIQVGGIPLIVGDEKNELIEYWKHSKWVNEANSRNSGDLQAVENKHAPLDYYFPLTLADLKKHSPESLAEIIDEYPEFALHILWHSLHPAPVNVPIAPTTTNKPEPVAPVASSPGVAPLRRRRSVASAA